MQPRTAAPARAHSVAVLAVSPPWPAMLGQGFPAGLRLDLAPFRTESLQTIAGLLFAADYEAMALRAFPEDT
jgi:hypothetical protein